MVVISVFGLGYVGSIISAGFSHLGHKIIGVDVNDKKVELIKSGKSPVVEKNLEKYLQEAKQKNLLEATKNVEYAIDNSSLSIICVGTPPKEDGSLNLQFTLKVCEQIALSLKEKDEYHLVVFKSTLFPGTVEKQLIPVLEEKSGKKACIDFGICHNPEFLREGSGMNDFFNPPMNIIGQLDKKSGDFLEAIYKGITTQHVRTDIKIGEMIKYVNNSFHALKIVFANEIGNIAKQVGVDSHTLMDVFCMDKVLNISKAYLKPGVPFGGSCLTKDPSALRFEAKKFGLSTPILDAIEESNNYHIKLCTQLIEKYNKKKVAILGISFKEDTDDLRSTPMIPIINSLLGKGYDIKIYDSNINKAQKFGVNKTIMEREIPHIVKHLYSDLRDVVESSEIIVIKNKDEETKKIKEMLKREQIVIDFVRQFEPKELKCTYEGINW